jgi:hypothetical protein
VLYIKLYKISNSSWSEVGSNILIIDMRHIYVHKFSSMKLAVTHFLKRTNLVLVKIAEMIHRL